MKEPHMELFVALTGVEKTHLALDLLEREYLNHFNFHCHYLPHPAIQHYVPPTEVGLD